MESQGIERAAKDCGIVGKAVETANTAATGINRESCMIGKDSSEETTISGDVPRDVPGYDCVRS